MVVLAPAGCRSLFHIPSQPADVEVTDPGWFPDVADVADPGSDHRDSGGHDADLPADPGQDSFHDPGCVTQCYGHPCGDDGCGGSCGTCPSGTQCATDGSQCLLMSVQIAFGGGCGPTEDCSPTVAISWLPGSGVANPSWPGCQDDQCREGPCVSGVCSRWCSLTRDIVQNGTGIPGTDGIDDDDAPAGDCQGALADRFPGAWACVEEELAAGPGGARGRCLPRSSFTPCDDGTPCPSGEACGYVKVRGNREARCLAATPGGGLLADPCGWDPGLGQARRCLAWNCSTRGCSAPCANDGACVTDAVQCDSASGTCRDGGASCATDADCSAWSCSTGVLIADPSGLYAACAPKACRIDQDCRDPAFYCLADVAQMIASAAGDPPGRCQRRLAGGAGEGQPCNTAAGDGRPVVPCSNEAYCFDGRCGALCTEDADCGAGQRCGLREFPTDANGDGKIDVNLRVPLCLTSGDPAPACLVASDCAADAACTAYVPATADPTRVDLLCMAPPTDAQPVGTACGAAAFGATCRSRACLLEDATDGVPGICSEPCRTRADCPDSSSFGSSTVRWTCEALPFSAAGTRVNTDDLWASWCVPVPGDSSLAPCDDTPVCANLDEYCRAAVRTGVPGGIDEVRWFCVKPTGGAAPGQPCTPSKDGSDCATGLCEPSALSGVGFCSLGCRTDADCGLVAGWGAVCAPRVVVPRSDPTASLSIPICRQVTSCVQCRVDEDCGPGLRCADASSVPYLRDYRCVAPCDVDADCVGQADGSICTSTAAPLDSSPSGSVKACLPITCA